MSKPPNKTNRPRELTPAELTAVRKRINAVRAHLHAMTQPKRSP